MFYNILSFLSTYVYTNIHCFSKIAFTFLITQFPLKSFYAGMQFLTRYTFNNTSITRPFVTFCNIFFTFRHLLIIVLYMYIYILDTLGLFAYIGCILDMLYAYWICYILDHTDHVAKMSVPGYCN